IERPEIGPAEQRLGRALGAVRASDALRAACANGAPDSSTIIPRTLSNGAVRLFPDEEPANAVEGCRGLIEATARARDGNANPVLPLRAHLFFRNVQGVWACSNPRCAAVHRRDQDILVGALYDRPTTTCQCGSRVLEMLYCEPCGDVFLGGYRREIPGNSGAWILVPDDPNIEKAPDHSAADREYGNYAVYWPARRPGGQLLQPQRTDWRHDQVRRDWKRAKYDPATGEISLARRAVDATGWIYYVPANHQVPPPAQLRASARNDRPSVCPRCDTNWSGMVNAAPIRTQRTGFQKIAQVLSDALLREVAPPAPGAPEDPRRKLVLFSDSRQDAAKLAVGVAKSHWLDALRQALVDSFSNEVNAVLAFQRLVRNEPLTPADRILAQRYFATNPVESAAIQADHLGIGGPPQRQLATETLSRARAGLVTTLALQSEAERRLLAVGMNPGGVDRSVMWTDPVNHSGDWPALFD